MERRSRSRSIVLVTAVATLLVTLVGGVAPSAQADGGGDVDPTFHPAAVADTDGNRVNHVLVQPDGKTLAAGDFTWFGNLPRRGIARVNANGTVDDSFVNTPQADAQDVYWMALQSDGKIIISGQHYWQGRASEPFLARLRTGGALDGSFNAGTGPNDSVLAMAVQPDDKIIIAGNFTAYNGVSRNRIARLHADGSLDSSFDPGTGADDAVDDVAVQPDGKILIAGRFTQYNQQPRERITRLNADGGLDTNFNTGGTGTNGWVSSLALQPDGKILVGGRFTQYNGGTVSANITRLMPNGQADGWFWPDYPYTSANDSVLSVSVQPDGMIIIAGSFTTYQNRSRGHVARLWGNGHLDLGFMANTDEYVQSVAVAPDGKIVVGGAFATVNGVARKYVARLLGTPLAPPSVPRSVTGEAGNTTATVSWQQPESDGGAAIDSYKVTASPGDHTWTGTGTTTTITGLINGTTYRFSVQAHNFAGWGDAAQTGEITPFTIPDAPRSVTAVPGHQSVAVSWLAPAFNGGASIDNYTVTAVPGGQTCTTSGVTCTVNGLTNGSDYQFNVKAHNTAGWGPVSPDSQAVTPRTVPDAPLSVTGVAGNRAATVSWQAPASDGGAAIDSYTVTALPGGRTCEMSGLTCTVTGLDNGTGYTFTVRAHNVAGFGSSSTPSSVVTPQTELVGHPGSLTFNNTRVDRQSDPQTVTLTNTTASALTVTSVERVGTNPGQFEIVDDSCSGRAIAGGGTCTLQVRFTPTATGAMSAGIRTKHSASADTVDVAVTGTGVQPQFSASTDTLDFDVVRTGSTGEPKQLTVTNSGTTDLTITDVGVTGDDADQFDPIDETCTGRAVGPNESCTVTVAFTARLPGADDARLRFNDDAPGAPHDIVLTGAGGAPDFEADPVDFADVRVGTTSDVAHVIVFNRGNWDLTIEGLSLAGGHPDDFTMADESCTHAPVPAGQACTVAVRFRPTATGAKAAVLRFADDASGSPHEVTLTGTGGTPKPPAPMITGISPAVGATSGGNTAVLRGQHLTGATVRFGSSTATITNATASELKVRVPARTAGRVDVTVTTAGGSGKAPGGYTYVTAPTAGKPVPVAGGYQFPISGLVVGAVLKPAAAVAGVSAVQVDGARITVRVQPTFSGKITQPVTVTEGAAQFRLLLRVTISPKAPTAVSYTPGARSTVRWTPGGNATGTQVLVDNSVKCTTAARVTSCTVAGWLGPKTRVQVRSLGGGNTSPLVSGSYRPPPAPALLGTVNFKATGKTLTSAVKRQLRQLAGVVTSRGLPTLLVTGQVPASKGKLATRTRLARTRANAVAKYLSARCRASGGTVRIAVKTATKPRRHIVTIAVT